jgi:hypothetical protein
MTASVGIRTPAKSGSAGAFLTDGSGRARTFFTAAVSVSEATLAASALASSAAGGGGR